jgi:hypothetical protein
MYIDRLPVIWNVTTAIKDPGGNVGSPVTEEVSTYWSVDYDPAGMGQSVAIAHAAAKFLEDRRQHIAIGAELVVLDLDVTENDVLPQ